MKNSTIKKSKFWNQLVLFIVTFLSVLILREFGENLLLENDITSYNTHTLLKLSANIILILFSFFLIKKNNLSELAGLKNTKLKKARLLIFPLLFLVLLNVLLMDNLSENIMFSNVFLLIIYCISIGFSEELSLRGFLQSHLIKHLQQSRKGTFTAIFLAALFFGIAHFLSFDKGLYGEISQAFFATFIGIMFGVLLLITKRIYPLIVIHAIIDFVAKIDTLGIPIEAKITEPMSIENSILVTLLVLPCLIYGVVLMTKYKTTISQIA